MSSQFTSNIHFPVYILITILFGLILFNAIFTPKEQLLSKPTKPDEQNEKVTSHNCLADDCLLVNEASFSITALPAEVNKALITAIQDEYQALALYRLVIEKYGKVKPFVTIYRAEEQHINALQALFEKYNLEIPIDNVSLQPNVFDSFKTACQAGAETEKANAFLYQNNLLPLVNDFADIKQVFGNLKEASENKHLPALSRCASNKSSL